LPDARDIADELTRRAVTLDIEGSRYEPSDPVGKLLFNSKFAVTGLSEAISN